jgi:sugar phosphate isomerase/epimerase
MTSSVSRRDWLKGACTAAGAGVLAAAPAAASEKDQKEPFGFCFNTSTIAGQKLSIKDEVDIAARAGYQAIEPWIRELDQFVKDGGDLKDLGKRIRDKGLAVPSAIGFAEWIVDDDGRRKKGLEEAKRSMDLVQQIGGARLAAPPVGATDQADLSLAKAAERYRALLEVGDKIGVIPQVEVWGFSKSLHRLSETMFVAMESGHPKACLLPDVYHLRKGGTDFNSVKLLGNATMYMFHVNDYPAEPGPAELTDAHRVYPGDGVAPWKTLLRDLRDIGFHGMLSLELFNREYWKQDAFEVAKTGLEKLKGVVQASLGQ